MEQEASSSKITNSEMDEEYNNIKDKMKTLCKYILQHYFEKIKFFETTLNEIPSITDTTLALGGAVGNGATGNLLTAGTDIASIARKWFKNNKNIQFAKRLNKIIKASYNNKENCQRILIEAGITIFIAYEFQFNKCYVDNKDCIRAMNKIADTIVNKILNSFKNNKLDEELSVEMILKCITEWDEMHVKPIQWIMDRISGNLKESRTIMLEYQNQSEACKTKHIFLKPGLRRNVNDEYQFHINTYTRSDVFGFRNCFENETPDETYIIIPSKDVNFSYNYKLSSINIIELTNEFVTDFNKSSADSSYMKVQIVLREILDEFKDIKNCTQNKTYNQCKFGMKSQVFNFVGRKHYLVVIKEYFKCNNNILVINGLPGIGKSELVKKYISDNVDEKYHNIIWINAEKEEDIQNSFSAIAKNFGIKEHAEVCTGDFSGMLRDIFLELRQQYMPSEKETLLIYDNVENHLMLNNYLPYEKELKDGKINIIITCRKTSLNPHYNVLSLDKFSDPESRSLIVETIINKENLQKILQENEMWANSVININDGLPLALQQAVAYIVEEERKGSINPFEIYINNHSDAYDKSFEDELGLSDYYDAKCRKNLYITYKIILDKLKGNKKNVTLMQICSFLNPMGVEKTILYKLLSRKDVDEAVNNLRRYSLIDCIDSLVVVHRVVQTITRRLYLAERFSKVFSNVLRFNLKFNFLIQLNSLTLVTSDRFFTFLESMYSTVIYQYVDENMEECIEFYKTLSGDEQVRFYLLLLYHGCTKTVEVLTKKEPINSFEENFTQQIDINKLCDNIKDIPESISEEKKHFLQALNESKYTGSALNIACIEGHTEIIKYLINEGADVNMTNKLQLPLTHVVLYKEYIEIFHYLLENKANISETDENGFTLLHVASSVGQYEIIKFLLKKNLQLDAKNKFGDNILHCCFYNLVYPKKQLKYLFTPITRENFMNDKYFQNELTNYFQEITKYSPISMFTENSGFAHKSEAYMSRYYKDLTKKQYSEIIDMYCRNLELNVPNNFGLYPLHLCALSFFILIKNIQFPNDMSTVDKFGNDPLMYACANDCFDAAKQIANEVNIKIRNMYGFTSLHSAACGGNYEIINFLQLNGRINETDSKGCSLLHVALLNKHYDLAKWLMDNDIDMNHTFDGISTLHLAAAAGQLEIVERHLGKHISIDQQDKSGWTALHYIVSASNGKNDNKYHQNNQENVLLRPFRVRDELEKLEVRKSQNIDNRLQRYSQPPIECDFAVKQYYTTYLKDQIDVTKSHLIKNPFTTLYEVSEEVQIQIVKLLISKNINVNLVTENNESCLHFACSLGRTQIAKELLDARININSSNKDGHSALHWAAYKGHLDTTKLLIASGANIKACCKNGFTVLHRALWGDYQSILTTLIEKGAEVNIRDNYGKSLLHWAAGMGYVATVKLLLTHGADIDACDNGEATALHWAVDEGHLDIIKILVEYKADNSKQDIDGMTALHWAAYKGHLATVELLTTLYEHMYSEVNKRDKYEQSALHFAAGNGHETTVEHLLTSGAEINACDNNDRTPLYWAVKKGYPNIAKILIEKGAKVNNKDKEERSVLHWAAYNGLQTTVELLLLNGADIHACGNDKSTALQYALQEGHTAIVKTLIKSEAEIYRRVIDGKSVLQWAANNGHLAAQDFLLASGTDIHACDKNEETALSLASSKGHAYVVDKLIENGAKSSPQD